MGKLNMGILGGFSGTVGTVIGTSNKKGEDIIRAKSKKVRTSFSEGQVNQQTKFRLVTGFMQPLNFLLKNSFKSVAGIQMTPYNYACKMALDQAITGDAPDFKLDFSKIHISEGKLSRETGSGAELLDGKIHFHWDDNSESGLCEAADKAVMLVYNVSKQEVSYSVGDVTRAAKIGDLPLPYNETGDELLFFLYFQSATNPLLFSTSNYVGTMVIE